MEQRVLVALSGGIDSASTVLMLREKGFIVEGLYIDMLGSSSAIEKVSDVARKLNITLHIENVREEFQNKIINYTLNEHQRGRTPSPCVVCNRLIKWEVAARVADHLGIYYIATGHYVRIIDAAVHKGADPAKDQSYYLWGLSEDILKRAMTPLGEYTKKQVREFLSNYDDFKDLADGGESMSICFVGRRPYNEFLSEYLSVRSGEVVNLAGDSIGKHDGYQLYTIGQKRGFTGGGTVVKLDATANRVITSSNAGDLYTDTIMLEDWKLDKSLISNNIQVKIRGVGRNPQKPLKSLNFLEDNSLQIILSEAEAWAVAEGQPVVLYVKDRVIGGGFVRGH